MERKTDALTKRGIIILIGIALIMVTIAVVAFFIGRAHNATNVRTGQELERAAELNRIIREEQYRTLDGITDSTDGIGRSLAALERIRSITEETNSSLGELGLSNRRSSDISAAIREEAYLLANYWSSVSHIIGDYFDNMGCE